MSLITLPNNIINGTPNDAIPVMQNYNAIVNVVNGNLDTTNMSPAALLGTGRFVLESAIGTSGGALPPIGSVIPWDDFNATVSFSTTYWRYCDGSVINSPASPLNGLSTRDMSGLYLVGYGTINGGNIDTAIYDATQTGNASHQINIQHLHTVDSHAHTSGTLQFKSLLVNLAGDLQGWDAGGVTHTLHNIRNVQAMVGGVPCFEEAPLAAADYFTQPGTGTGATGSTVGATGNSLSTTQNIQPRSTRVRYIVRIL